MSDATVIKSTDTGDCNDCDFRCNSYCTLISMEIADNEKCILGDHRGDTDGHNRTGIKCDVESKSSK